MSDAVLGAMVGVTGAVVVGFLANFVSEDYRRFRDGKALAGAIAGELSSYAEALPMLDGAFSAMLGHLAAGSPIRLPAIEKPVDRIFDGSVDKLGLLGHERVEEVVHVYNNLNAFRVSMALLNAEGLTVDEQAARVKASQVALARAAQRGLGLLERLRAFASRTYWPFSG